MQDRKDVQPRADRESEPQARVFTKIGQGLLDDPEVTQGTGFGATPGLRWRARIFAMLARGGLVVKLPRRRVDELIASGLAEPFDPRRDGRVMKEWVTIPVSRIRDWDSLVAESLLFAKLPDKDERADPAKPGTHRIPAGPAGWHCGRGHVRRRHADRSSGVALADLASSGPRTQAGSTWSLRSAPGR